MNVPQHSAPPVNQSLATSQPSAATPTKGGSLGGVVSVKQGLTSMWHGLTLPGFLELFSKQPPCSLSRMPRVLSVFAASLSNSLHSITDSVLYGRQVAATKIEHPPIFILGHWRSGTTLLHNLMTLDPQFTFPTLYQVLFPYHFLSTQRWLAPITAWTLPKTRPMDNLPTSWSMPQEDEIALLLMCGVSPYLMMAFQNNRPFYEKYLALTDVRPRELERWKASFEYFLKKLTLKTNKPVVFKSPSHSYRIPLLLEMFPQAKFVYIYRDPYAVMRSSLHLRNTMFVENAFGKIDFSTSEEDCFSLYEQCIRRYESTKHLIPAGNLHEVKFEDLEVDPYGQVKQVYDRLQLPGWSGLDPILAAQVPELTSYQKNRFSMERETMQRVYDRCRYSFETYGYPSRLDEPVAG